MLTCAVPAAAISPASATAATTSSAASLSAAFFARVLRFVFAGALSHRLGGLIHFDHVGFGFIGLINLIDLDNRFACCR